MFPPQETTEGGLETQLTVNYLGHFLLTSLLTEHMKVSAKPQRWGRIVNLASSVSLVGSIDMDDFKSRYIFKTVI